MKFGVIDSFHVCKPGQTPAFVIKVLELNPDGSFKLIQRKDYKSGMFTPSLYIRAEIIEHGELIEVGDILEFESNLSGEISKCKRIPNEKLSIKILNR